MDQNAPFVQRRYSSHSPIDDHRWKVESIVSFGSNIITTAMAYVDVLFTDKELANGNTSGSNGYQQLDELKDLFLESTLRQKFDSPVFTSQWEKIQCFGLQYTVFFPTCHTLMTWFELSRVKLSRNELKGNKNYFELAGGSSYRG